jgi:hypothetical protein
MKRAMASATRVECDKEAMVARAMATRVVGK